MQTPPVSVAIIGSFRQYYAEVLDAWKTFVERGIEVSSPRGTRIVEEGVPFVRFESDRIDLDDPAVQSLALHRIMRAAAVLVVAPYGYVGRTTCYEIGRLIQARRPLYFTETPVDLPIRIPLAHITTAATLAERLSGEEWIPEPLFARSLSSDDSLERSLLDGDIRAD